MKSQPPSGVSSELAPGVRLVIAPNPGPMTYWGTNTYIFGEGRVAIIDPGPNNAEHIQSLLSATKGEIVTHILVTHAHADHAEAAPALSRQTGAPIYAFGPPDAGRRPTMEHLARQGVRSGEGVFSEFAPDERVSDGDIVVGDGWSLEVLHIPGHFSGHLAFKSDDTVFSGDHIMDWSTSIVAPPDGDMSAFLSSCERLKSLPIATLHTGHGGPITSPTEKIEALIVHRRAREKKILECLNANQQTLKEVTARAYPDISEALFPAAMQSAFAHLVDLFEQQVIKVAPELGPEASFFV